MDLPQRVITPDPGQELCYECGGRRFCLYCRGKGRFSDDDLCYSCAGSGWCIVCNGAGQLPEGTEKRLGPPKAR